MRTKEELLTLIGQTNDLNDLLKIMSEVVIWADKRNQEDTEVLVKTITDKSETIKQKTDENK